ncbi:MULTISPECIES: amidohydrolase [unclassified Rhodococcus (in: high G+C Gram-positive bacteria)]|uniref:amidohydrolase n=1 Tax=unclassified Rhodococcus (in: high G+C Gram-positive bacteria) TaxID=192944 RepID=UPI000B148CB6|nr:MULTISPECIES: amidohydrolase family protein [unclassified Rhodococcus (in: high G+C Gram-positive bacteria)]
MNNNAAADTVLRGGPILDLSDWVPGDRATSAWIASRPTKIAVKDGEIVALGDDVDRWIGKNTRVVELDGNTVIPGINDGHLHFTAYSVTAHTYVKMHADVFTVIAQLPQFLTGDAVDSSGWIRGHGWDSQVLGRNLTARDIDDALAVNGIHGTPVVLFDWSGHSLCANSVALDLAGISAQTSDPEGGVIARDGGGNPEGFLTDAAIALLIAAVPPVPREQLLDAYRAGQADLHALGITALTEPGLGPGHVSLLDGSGSPEALEALGDFATDGELTMRVSVLVLPVGTGGCNAADVRAHLDAGLARAYDGRDIDPRRLKIVGVKVFADGTPQNGTTWHKEPVHEINVPGHRCGHLVVAGNSDVDKVAELKEIIRAVDDAGLQIGIHSIGDQTVETVIDLIAEVAPNSPARHYLIHTTELYEGGIETLVDNGIGACFNPVIISTFATMLPEERVRRTEPIGSALRAGVRPGITSDSPVVPPDWRPAVVYAVSRSHCWSGPVPADDTEGITTLDALASITREAAYREHGEGWRGTLMVGHRADLAVLHGQWPDDADVDSLLGRTIALTMVDGEIVHAH